MVSGTDMPCTECHRQAGRHNYGCPYFRLTDEADVVEFLLSREEEERKAQTEESYIAALEKEMKLPGAWLSMDLIGERGRFTWRGNRVSFDVERFDSKRDRDEWISRVVRIITAELERTPCAHVGWKFRYVADLAPISEYCAPRAAYVSRERCCLDCGETLISG